MAKNATVIGSEDLLVSTVASVLKTSPSFHDNWFLVARDLGTENSLLTTLRMNYRRNAIDISHISYELIEEWVGRKCQTATLQELVQILHKNGVKDCGEYLENLTNPGKLGKISDDTKNSDKNNVVLRKYYQIPNVLTEFLASPSAYCLLRTPDCKITSQKIKENVKKSCFYDWQNFAEILASSEKHEGNAIYVVEDCTLRDLKQLKTLRDYIGSKIILLTSEEENNVAYFLNKHASWKNKVILISDNMDWDDLATSFQIKIIQQLEQKYKIGFEEVQLNGQLLVDLINGEAVKLFKDTLPEELSYYINRTLSTRDHISMKVFEQNSPDIFLLTGIERYELSSLADKRVTDNSTNQLKSSRPTVNFITLDKPYHFGKLAARTSNAVHLINFKDLRLRWIKSNGNLQTLKQYVHPSQDELAEEEFVQKIHTKSNQAVIISDSPGMGKSVLLRMMGKRLTIRYPERAVFFLVVDNFIRHFNDAHRDELITRIKTVLGSILCHNAIGKAVLIHKLHSEEILIELLLDGFDNLQSSQFNLAYEVLQTITSIKAIRLWVTSRPHLLEELENKLNVFGHNIKPFDEMNQIRFLTSYWLKNSLLNQTRLEKFAMECLQNLRNKMDLRDNDIAGIPLQCYMLGYIFEEDAIANGISEDALPQPTIFTNITDLYKSLIAKKFARYETQRRMSLMKMHVKLSLELIFSEDLNKLEELLSPIEVEELFRVGIVESTGIENSPRFLHRTFAEYFLAWLVVDRLGSESSWNDGLTEFLFGRVLQCEAHPEWFKHDGSNKDMYVFSYPVIAYFLDALVVDIAAIPSSTCQTFIKICGASAQTGIKIVNACVSHNFARILRMLDSTRAFEQHPAEIFSKRCILLSIDHAEVELVKFVLEHFEQNHKWGVDVQREVLLRAIKRGLFSIVEFLVKEKGCRPVIENFKGKAHGFLHACVKETNSKSGSEIEERVQILRLLVMIQKELLEEWNENDETPLLADGVHVELRVELVRMGANIFAINMYQQNILHKVINIPSIDYHSFVVSLSSESLRRLVHMKDSEGQTPLMRVLQSFEPLQETLTLFKDVGADVSIANNFQASMEY